MIELRKVGPLLTEETLARFERELGVSLPGPYRRFLLRNNGGRPPSDKDVVDVEGLPGGAASIQFFFGFSYPLECYDLRWNKETLCERIPDNRLAIAGDSSGNVFCISLGGADHGAVSYCDLQSVYARFDVKPEFYPVAPDFDSFLSNLRELPDPPAEGCIETTAAGPVGSCG